MNSETTRALEMEAALEQIEPKIERKGLSDKERVERALKQLPEAEAKKKKADEGEEARETRMKDQDVREPTESAAGRTPSRITVRVRCG